MAIDIMRTISGLAYLLVYFACFAAFLCLPVILLYLGIRSMSVACVAIFSKETKWAQVLASLMLATLAVLAAYAFAIWFVLPLLSGSGMNS